MSWNSFLVVGSLNLSIILSSFAGESEFTPLFKEDGSPKGWIVRAWSDVSKPGPANAQWSVKDQVLIGGGTRGSWLISEKEYSDFELHFDFKLGPRGNSGCALRTPISGDPAFDGLELQMADFRYNPQAQPSELTGGLYRALAPEKQVYRPEKWNSYKILLRGSMVTVYLNDFLIIQQDLQKEDRQVKRHNGQNAPALKDRPRKGRLGFQNLGRDEQPVLIRNAIIKVFE